MRNKNKVNYQYLNKQYGPNRQYYNQNSQYNPQANNNYLGPFYEQNPHYRSNINYNPYPNSFNNPHNYNRYNQNYNSYNPNQNYSNNTLSFEAFNRQYAEQFKPQQTHYNNEFNIAEQYKDFNVTENSEDLKPPVLFEDIEEIESNVKNVVNVQSFDVPKYKQKKIKPRKDTAKQYLDSAALDALLYEIDRNLQFIKHKNIDFDKIYHFNNNTNQSSIEQEMKMLKEDESFHNYDDKYLTSTIDDLIAINLEENILKTKTFNLNSSDYDEEPIIELSEKQVEETETKPYSSSFYETILSSAKLDSEKKLYSDINDDVNQTISFSDEYDSEILDSQIIEKTIDVNAKKLNNDLDSAYIPDEVIESEQELIESEELEINSEENQSLENTYYFDDDIEEEFEHQNILPNFNLESNDNENELNDFLENDADDQLIASEDNLENIGNIDEYGNESINNSELLDEENDADPDDSQMELLKSFNEHSSIENRIGIAYSNDKLNQFVGLETDNNVDKIQTYAVVKSKRKILMTVLIFLGILFLVSVGIVTTYYASADFRSWFENLTGLVLPKLL